MRIAHLAAEVSPFAKTGGLGDVVGALPVAQKALGHDVHVWMPYYRQVRQHLERRGTPPEVVVGNMHIDLGFRRHEFALLKTHLPDSTVPVFMIAADQFFDRAQIYSSFYGVDDGLQRYAFFVRAVMECMRQQNLIPDVLNAHDWHMALAPMAVKWDEPRDWQFQRTVTVLTVHNMAYQGIYDPGMFHGLGLPASVWPGLEWDGALNLMKGGLMAADAITAVSPTFAHEISTSDGGFGLDWAIRYRGPDVHGILNGIDSRVWNPTLDKKIPYNYDARHPEGKLKNRRALLSMAGMDRDDRGLVIGVVGRLTRQKGYDMLFPVLWDLLADGIRMVFLGSGEPALEGEVHKFSYQARGRFWGFVGFSDELAHLIEAGADAFLMPSRFEPCGLNQMYSLAYGTPPIVRRVGGLKDTVVGFDGHNAEWANGFGFDEASPHALRETVRWAARCYRDPYLWTKLVHNGMSRDFSWQRSAEAYLGLYQHYLNRKG
ncbi:MAG: glycogen synthase [Myxococcota bacterium]